MAVWAETGGCTRSWLLLWNLLSAQILSFLLLDKREASVLGTRGFPTVC